MLALLFIDTSSTDGFVFVSKNAEVIGLQSLTDLQLQSAQINTAIETSLAMANVNLQDIDAMVVCAGPGSYTGLRVALSTAKGLCYALDKPLMCFDKLELLAASYAHNIEHNIAVVLKARVGEYFAAVYDNNLHTVIAPKHFFEQDLPTLLSKEIDVLVSDEELSDKVTCSASILASKYDLNQWVIRATQRFQANQFDDVAYSEPFYLKAAFTTTPKKKL